MMSVVSAADAQRLAYKDMSNGKYFVSTICLYGLIVVLGTQLGDITTVIDFLAAYSVSSQAFFVPSVFYYKAVKKFNIEKTQEVKNRLVVAMLFIPIGIIIASLSILSAFLYIFGLTAS